MSLIHINKNPSVRELKWFGLLFLLFSAIVGALLRWVYGAQTASLVVLGIAALLTAAYYAVKDFRRPLFVGWMYAAMPIGAVVSIGLLAATYFLVVTPVGLLVRIFSHDPMTRRFDVKASTYWVRRPEPAKPNQYFRQF